MTNTVLFFGVLEDVCGMKEYTYSDFQTTNLLLEKLKTEFPKLDERTFQIAVNQKIINRNTTGLE